MALFTEEPEVFVASELQEATKAKYEARLATLEADAARWRYVRDNATRMVSPIQNYKTWNADAGVVASFSLTLPSVPPFATQPEAAIDAARTPAPEPK